MLYHPTAGEMRFVRLMYSCGYDNGLFLPNYTDKYVCVHVCVCVCVCVCVFVCVLQNAALRS